MLNTSLTANNLSKQALLVKFPYGKQTSRTSNKVKVEYRPTEIETQRSDTQLLLTLRRMKVKLIWLRGFLLLN